MILIDLEGLELTTEDRELLSHPKVAGVILFTRNYESLEQLRSLTSEIKKILPRAIVAVDQEGGRVQRFRKDFTHLPAMRHWGLLYDQDKETAQIELAATTQTMIKELQRVGVNVSFSPILDIDHGISEVIGARSFHINPEVLITLATTAIKTMHQNHMPACGKHFPGHGGVAQDSHHTLPIDERSLDTLSASDLRPFATLASELDSIMTAHVVYPAIDRLPVCFSSIWLQTILRQQLHFKGVIICDDLSMEGAAMIGGYQQRAEQALAAGCDLLLACNNRSGAIEVLKAVANHQDLASEQRINLYLDRIYK